MLFMFDDEASMYAYMATTATVLSSLAWMTYYYYTKGTAPPLDLKTYDLQDVAHGAFEGALHIQDLDNILGCVSDKYGTVKEIDEAIKRFMVPDLTLYHVSSGFSELGEQLVKLSDAAEYCDNELDEREKRIFKEMLQAFIHPDKLRFKSGESIVINGVDIYNEMRGAFANYIGKDYRQFGRDLGVALALTFIGANDAAKLSPGAAQEAIAEATKSLFPRFNKEIYDDENNRAYVDYLDYISTHGNVNDAQPIMDGNAPSDILYILEPAAAAAVPTYNDGEAWYDAEERVQQQLVLLNLLAGLQRGNPQPLGQAYLIL